MLVLAVGAARADSVYRDEFDLVHDYASGDVPINGIWSGIHNPTNGGGAFLSDGFLEGKLFVQDLNLHPNPSLARPFGVGWEAAFDGSPAWNNAPFLFRDVAAEQDFDATIKIDSQTGGNWSHAALIARRKGPTVGVDAGESLDPDESFLTIGSFPMSSNSNPSGVLAQNIVNAVETGYPLVPSATLGVFPLWLRLSKRGAEFTSQSSADGVNWISHHLLINPELNTAGETVEIGFSYMQFGAATVRPVAGATSLDFFELRVIPEPSFLALALSGLILWPLVRRESI
jgi:hypothetical protein